MEFMEFMDNHGALNPRMIIGSSLNCRLFKLFGLCSDIEEVDLNSKSESLKNRNKGSCEIGKLRKDEYFKNRISEHFSPSH